MKHAARACILAAVAAAALGAGGCLGPEVVVTAGVTAAEAGSSAYNRGELVQSYKAPLNQVVAAAKRAIAVLELRAGTERIDARSAFLMARETGGREIAMRFEEVSPQVTRIKIRAGVWGEPSLSRLVMSEIESNLAVPRR